MFSLSGFFISPNAVPLLASRTIAPDKKRWSYSLKIHYSIVMDCTEFIFTDTCQFYVAFVWHFLSE